MSLFNDTDLFSSGPGQSKMYELPDAIVRLHEQLFHKTEADRLYQLLLEQVQWKQEEITVYNKTHLTPRLTAWYGDAATEYTYSGTKHFPHPWTNDLQYIRERVEEEAGYPFNSALLNLYRDGRDGVGWHRDNEKEFGENPAIASVSFGATRIFQLRHKFRKELEKVDIPLHHGSFLLMAGTTQHYWEHQIPKTAQTVAPRINLTFRMVVR